MTPVKIAELMQVYIDRLREDPFYEVPRRSENTVGGVRISTQHALEHAGWMCREVVKFCGQGRGDKANRWLGFIQGVLWCCGVFSIDEMRYHNMPEGAVYHERT